MYIINRLLQFRQNLISFSNNAPNALFCFSIGTLIKYIPFVKDKKNDDPSKENTNIIKEADELYEKGFYWDVYNLLNEQKSSGIEYYSDGEILWRVCRVLYVISNDKTATKEYCGEIVNEAYKLISIAYLNKENHAEINKWMGIIVNRKSELEGRRIQLKNAAIIKAHLLKAHQLNPNDNITLYMLGHWCYSFASLSWFQKKFLKMFYGTVVPDTSYEEALDYFLKCEDMKPRSLVPNLYMIGKVYLALNHYFRAKYYLSAAVGMDITNRNEIVYKQDAMKLLQILNIFDITQFFGFVDF